MTVYIAGPMTGIQQENLPAFEKSKEFFEANGYDVIIPHDIAKANPTVTKYGELLAIDIFTIGTKCQLVAMLPFWRSSKGACIEYAFARAANMPIVDATNGYVLPKQYPTNHATSFVDDHSLDSIIDHCKVIRYGKICEQSQEVHATADSPARADN